MSGKVAYLKARPTLYKGIQMRSRLEALFAQWLDTSGTAYADTPWHYEPVCFGDAEGQYLPDFLLKCENWDEPYNLYVEIKPEIADFDDALRRMHVILATEPGAHLRVFTNQGSYESPSFGPVRSCSPSSPCCIGRQMDGRLAFMADGAFGGEDAAHNGYLTHTRREVVAVGLVPVCPKCHSEEIDFVGTSSASGQFMGGLDFECYGCCDSFTIGIRDRHGKPLLSTTHREWYDKHDLGESQ